MLGGDGRYVPAAMDGGVYASRVLVGLRLPVAWLWSPPPLVEALRQLGLL